MFTGIKNDYSSNDFSSVAGIYCWSGFSSVILVGEKMIELNECALAALDNAKLRQANGARIDFRTYTMLKHCATEVIEATESYGYVANEIPGTYEDIDLPLEEMHERNKSHFASELADIICCCLIIAANESIDIERSVFDCLYKNRKRAEGKGDKK